MSHTSGTLSRHQESLESVREAIESAIKSLKKTHEYPVARDNQQPRQDVRPESHDLTRDEQKTNRVLDMVEEVANLTSDMVQDLRLLRKALPTTYFKNRSRVRDTLEAVEAKAAASRERIFSIMDNLQLLNMAGRRTGSLSPMLREVEERLVAVRNNFETLGAKEPTLTPDPEE